MSWSRSPQHQSRSLRFYRAVRDLQPVWRLEDMRTMETFYLEADDTPRPYSPSEALLYAIVHDHRAYARYLLSHHAEEALSRPGEHRHLAMTVRYDRRVILGLILREEARRHAPGACPSVDPGGCWHVEDGKTPLHLACELARPDAVTMLLGNGASPRVQDRRGRTPLDLLLARFREPRGGERPAERRRCLDNLLMFMPAERHFNMKGALHGEPDYWSEALGEATFQYLVGRTPAALVLAAMQAVLRQLSPAGFPDSLQELPIPSALNPLSPAPLRPASREIEDETFVC
ncbi:hypothetical protein NHX12_025756 [Muraenolepis orangiensis]|uniref:Ankyrin repeat domain-containing protein n=1 Tax=Muraenolepis orangiensis TaxID=630683 RepID=A0A9Q0IR97_9TELE|nr:hypothetical protein NHX12_025756 [Muraenolepis orangiensis]